MQIVSSQVSMAAGHVESETRSQSARLQIRADDANRELRPPPHRPSAPPGLDRLELSTAARGHRMRRGEMHLDGHARSRDPVADFEVSLMKTLVEAITGRAIRVVDPNELVAETDQDDSSAPAGAAAAPRSEGPRGPGLVFSFSETRTETEHTEFSAQGVARTADGREIRFDVSLAMSRSFSESLSVELRSGAAVKDPLVLNFDGQAAELGERNFHFDLDMDGTADQIAFVSAGSGFLALDRNADGRVNDGSELFGPSSGDGFSELASDGSSSLMALGRRGVGAIYLGKVATPFALRDADNAALGELRSSGVFLSEDGSAGTVQQLDLVV